MARIRTIKPTFFKSDDVADLSFRARLTWIGLWTSADDAGRTKDHVKLIKADVWPLDEVTLADIEDDLRELAGKGRIVRYEFGGDRYLQITNWTKHQKINRPSPSHIPPPPLTAVPQIQAPGPGPGAGFAPAVALVAEPRETGSYPQVSTHGQFSEDSRGEGKGREGKGRDARTESVHGTAVDNSAQEPPRNCEDHEGQKNPPACGRCKQQRQAHEQWLADRRRRVDEAPKCRYHRGQLAYNCAGCRADRLATA